MMTIPPQNIAQQTVLDMAGRLSSSLSGDVSIVDERFFSVGGYSGLLAYVYQSKTHPRGVGTLTVELVIKNIGRFNVWERRERTNLAPPYELEANFTIAAADKQMPSHMADKDFDPANPLSLPNSYGLQTLVESGISLLRESLDVSRRRDQALPLVVSPHEGGYGLGLHCQMFYNEALLYAKSLNGRTV